MRESEIRFIRQLGFTTESADRALYTALMFQPRVIAVIVTVGIVLQSPAIFLALSAALLLSASVPGRNPFTAIYNHVVAPARSLSPVPLAPEPRRGAEGMAGTAALAIGTALAAGATALAWAIEGMFVVALVGVIVGKNCAGATMYCLLRRAWTPGACASKVTP